jgi:hypothetical protein
MKNHEWAKRVFRDEARRFYNLPQMNNALFANLTTNDANKQTDSTRKIKHPLMLTGVVSGRVMATESCVKILFGN